MKYKFLTIEELKKENASLNKHFYMVKPIWKAMVLKMVACGWRFIQFIPGLRMRSEGPYGYYIFEKEDKKSIDEVVKGGYNDSK